MGGQLSGIRDHAAVVVSGEINRGEEEFARELTNILRDPVRGERPPYRPFSCVT
jgi:hypothetical protein